MENDLGKVSVTTRSFAHQLHSGCGLRSRYNMIYNSSSSNILKKKQQQTDLTYEENIETA